MKLIFLGNTCSGKSTLIRSVNNILKWEVIAIDEFRKVHGNFFWDGNRKAQQHFINSIRLHGENQIIEASGMGITAQRLKETVNKIDDKIKLVIMNTSALTCRDRAYAKDWTELKMPDAHPREIEYRIKSYDLKKITAEYFRHEQLLLDGEKEIELLTNKVLEYVTA